MLFIVNHSFLCKHIYCTGAASVMETAGLAVSHAEKHGKLTWLNPFLLLLIVVQ